MGQIEYNEGIYDWQLGWKTEYDSCSSKADDLGVIQMEHSTDYQLSLDKHLLALCTVDAPDYEAIAQLLREGADPMGYIPVEEDYVYGAVLYHYFGFTVEYDEALWDTMSGHLLEITNIFLEYGMDINHPKVPFGPLTDSPMQWFDHCGGDAMLQVLRLLLEHGVERRGIDSCLGYITDRIDGMGTFSDDKDIADFRHYVREILLMASFPYAVECSKRLRKLICYDTNLYDLTKFREWDWYIIALEDVDVPRHKAQTMYTPIKIIDSSPDGDKRVVWQFDMHSEEYKMLY